MSSREIIPFVIAFIGGMGGLVNALVWSDILSIVNQSRPVDDQIRFAITSLSDLQSRIKFSPFYVWRIVKDFHQRFPQNRLYYWCWGSAGWMVFCFVAFIMIIFAR